MSNRRKDDDIDEILKPDEIIPTSSNLPTNLPNISFSSIIPSVLLPIVNTFASPIYKKQIIEAQAGIKNNTIIANERKYRAILDLIRDLTMSNKMTPELLELLKRELEKFS